MAIPPGADFILDIEQGAQSAIGLLKKLSSDKTPIAGQKIPQRCVEGMVGNRPRVRQYPHVIGVQHCTKRAFRSLRLGG